MGEGLRSAVELSLAEVGEGVAAVWVVDAVGCGRDESGVERPLFGRVAWQLAPPTSGPTAGPPTVVRTRQTRVPAELLQALADNAAGLGVRELSDVGMADSTLRKHLKRALDIGLIASTTDSIHDPHRRYTLTKLGQRQLNR